MGTVLAPTHRPGHSRFGADLLVRRAGPEDVVELAALKRRVEARAYAHLGTPEALSVRLRQRCTAWHLLTLIGEGDLVLTAEIDGQLIGMAAAAIVPDTEEATVRLHSAYVERPGRGAGRALTVARLEAAAGVGLTRVVADCLVGAHRAQERLQSLGLVREDRLTPCPTFPGVTVSHWTGSLDTALARALEG